VAEAASIAWEAHLDELAEMCRHALPPSKDKPSPYFRGPQDFQSIQIDSETRGNRTRWSLFPLPYATRIGQWSRSVLQSHVRQFSVPPAGEEQPV
jgi:hypothetical protein